LENEYGEYLREQAEDLLNRLRPKPGYEIVKVFCCAQWFYVHWRKDSDPESVNGEWDEKWDDTFPTNDENGDPVREIIIPFRMVQDGDYRFQMKLKIPKRLLKIADVNLED